GLVGSEVRLVGPRFAQVTGEVLLGPPSRTLLSLVASARLISCSCWNARWRSAAVFWPKAVRPAINQACRLVGWSWSGSPDSRLSRRRGFLPDGTTPAKAIRAISAKDRPRPHVLCLRDISNPLSSLSSLFLSLAVLRRLRSILLARVPVKVLRIRKPVQFAE